MVTCDGGHCRFRTGEETAVLGTNGSGLLDGSGVDGRGLSGIGLSDGGGVGEVVCSLPSPLVGCLGGRAGRGIGSEPSTGNLGLVGGRGLSAFGELVDPDLRGIGNWEWDLSFTVSAFCSGSGIGLGSAAFCSGSGMGLGWATFCLGSGMGLSWATFCSGSMAGAATSTCCTALLGVGLDGGLGWLAAGSVGWSNGVGLGGGLGWLAAGSVGSVGWSNGVGLGGNCTGFGLGKGLGKVTFGSAASRGRSASAFPEAWFGSHCCRTAIGGVFGGCAFGGTCLFATERGLSLSPSCSPCSASGDGGGGDDGGALTLGGFSTSLTSLLCDNNEKRFSSSDFSSRDVADLLSSMLAPGVFFLSSCPAQGGGASSSVFPLC